MSQFVVAIVSDQAGVDNVNRVLEKLGRDGTTIYRSAVLYKNSDGRISTTHRVAERSKAVVTAAAFIGALAGFPAGLEAALAGAMGGGAIRHISRNDKSRRRQSNYSKSVA
jgi:uncharacterized membrane protein